MSKTQKLPESVSKCILVLSCSVNQLVTMSVVSVWKNPDYPVCVCVCCFASCKVMIFSAIVENLLSLRTMWFSSKLCVGVCRVGSCVDLHFLCCIRVSYVSRWTKKDAFIQKEPPTGKTIHSSGSSTTTKKSNEKKKTGFQSGAWYSSVY